MKIIDVNTTHPYKVIIGTDLISKCGKGIKKYAGISENASIAAIITDDNVGPLYAKRVEDSLRSEGFEPITFTVPSGEASKSMEMYEAAMEFLADHNVTRTDFIVALGGGVVGDLAGFVAATYLRSIDLIQIPTTLLAAVDSSVGGKTGIDIGAGKNLVGAFYQPKIVVCDLDTLDTLDDVVFTEGCAEVIKYGVLGDGALFAHLSQHAKRFNREMVISRCIEMKRDLVVQDEFDHGSRRLLNLGHTLGHAVELLNNYSMYHGLAVSIGMSVVARAAAKQGICSTECAGRIIAVLTRFGLPVNCDYTIDELYESMQKDKKRKGDSISIVIPNSIGVCEIRKMSLDEMRAFMESGL